MSKKNKILTHKDLSSCNEDLDMEHLQVVFFPYLYLPDTFGPDLLY